MGPPATYRGVEMTPDGRLLLVHREEVAGGDIWAYDLERGTQTRLTFDRGGHSASPVLLPGGRRMLFVKIQSRTLYEKDVTGVGAERLVYKSPGPPIQPWTVTPDGATAIVSIGELRDSHLAAVPLAGGEPRPLAKRPGSQIQAQISPDGRWIAYTSSESGSQDVFIESFPAGDTRYQVSSGGGRVPRWRADARELFYVAVVSGRTAMMSAGVDVQGQALRLGIPKMLFNAALPNTQHVMPVLAYAVTGDGARFMMVRRPESQLNGSSTTPITVVMNWPHVFAAK